MSKSATTQLLNYYEAMLVFTREMLNAARTGDWDSLVDMEAKRGAVEQILAHSDSESWTGNGARKKAEILQAILVANQETRDLAAERRSTLQGMIGSVGTEKKLNSAYNLR